MTDSLQNSKVPLQDSEIMESAPSPVSVHHTDSKGHTDSLDEDEDINMNVDDDDTEIIESMKPSDMVRVYDTVNKIKNFPRYQPKSCQETLMDIVISLVGLMRYLKCTKNYQRLMQKKQRIS